MKRILIVILIFSANALFGQESQEDYSSTILRSDSLLLKDFIKNVTLNIQDSHYLKSILITPEILSQVPDSINKESYLRDLDKWTDIHNRWSYLTHINFSKLAKCDSFNLVEQRNGKKLKSLNHIFRDAVLLLRCNEEYKLFEISIINFNGIYYIESIYEVYPDVKINIFYDQRAIEY